MFMFQKNCLNHRYLFECFIKKSKYNIYIDSSKIKEKLRTAYLANTFY